MPLPQNLNVLLGAGVFGIVCAATLYVVEHYRQERRRHSMAKDLARLDTELTVLRQELNTLLNQQRHKYFYDILTPQIPQNRYRVRRAKRPKKVESFISTSTTTEDYSSAVDVDSSDLEFYDVSDDEVDVTITTLDNELALIDPKLDENNAAGVEACLKRLEDLCIEHPENPELLWRIAKAHYRLFEKTEQKENITKGIEACTLALTFKPELANVHKWMAVLVGTRSQFQPMKERILDGHLFKKHVDAALELNPVDSTIHHMQGRFAFDLAELKWYERKVAAALFAEVPSATYEQALEHFLEAEKLASHEWKENKLYIAKCYIKLGQMEEAVKALEEADGYVRDNGVDYQIDVEVKELLKKYTN